VAAGDDNPALPPYDAVFVMNTGSIQPGGTPVAGIALAAPRPNPSFGETATLSYALAPGEPATLDVVDLKGRMVRRLWAGTGSGGAQTVLWDGLDDRGARVPSGVYFARLVGIAGRTAQQKLVRGR
jgi:hypothetical protein